LLEMAQLSSSTVKGEASSRTFAFLDFDIDNHRERLSRTAAFVQATDTRYGWSSKDLRHIGGSELPRVKEALVEDHDWGSTDPVVVKPPPCGCRVVVELFPAVAPLASENFLRLCRGAEPALGACGKKLTYEGSRIHRVESQFVIQGGDFVMGNGSGGESVVNNGKKFKDEKAGLLLPHGAAGVLSMGNSGKNSNSSQFFFTLAPAPACDKKHVVFGRVVSGLEVLRAVEARAGSDSGGEPRCGVAVTACGGWVPGRDAGQGYWVDCPDPGAFGGSVPRFFSRPRVGLVCSSSGASQRFIAALRAAYFDESSGGGGGGGAVQESDGRGPSVLVSIVDDGNGSANESSVEVDAGTEQSTETGEGSSVSFDALPRHWRDDVSIAVDLVVIAQACASALPQLARSAVEDGGCAENRAAVAVVVSKPNPEMLAPHLGPSASWRQWQSNCD